MDGPILPLPTHKRRSYQATPVRELSSLAPTDFPPLPTKPPQDDPTATTIDPPPSLKPRPLMAP